MNLHDAYDILRLEEPFDAKTARRAYLRAVKRHKPEHDPDGFQRVRAAYERVKESLEWSAPRGRPVILPHRPPAQEEPTATDAPSVPEPLPLERAAVEERTWTVKAILGEPFLLPVLQLQEATEAAEIDAELALSLLTDAMRVAQLHPEHSPSVREALEPVLFLHRGGYGKEGQLAWLQVKAWISASGLGTQMPASVAGRVLLTRELSELPSHFPTDLRRRIAQGILNNDIVSAQPDLLDFARVQQLRAEQAAADLAEHAPNLHTLFEQVLLPPSSPPPVEPEPVEEPLPPLGLRVLIAVLLIVFVLLIALLSPSSTRSIPVNVGAPSFVMEATLCGELPDLCEPLTQLRLASQRGDCDAVFEWTPMLEAKVAAANNPDATSWLDSYLILLDNPCTDPK